MVNHFSIMLQKRFREQDRGDDDDDEAEKQGKKKKKKSGGRGGDLRIHDLEDDLEMSSNDSDSSMGEGKDESQRFTAASSYQIKVILTFHLLC